MLAPAGLHRSLAEDVRAEMTCEMLATLDSGRWKRSRFQLDREKLKEAELHDGHYLLRSNLSDKEPEYLWELYMLLVEIDVVFPTT